MEEYMKPLGISQEELAKHLDCDQRVIKLIISERAGVTPEMAAKFAAVFDTTPEFWLNAQMAMDAWV